MGSASPGPGPNPTPNNSWYDAQHNSSLTTVAGDTPAFQAWALLLFTLSLGTAFGNMLVVLSVTREKSLQTVTNYFLISLAVADIMVGVCVMPFEIYMEMWSGLWTLQVNFCDAYLALDVMSATASILNLAAISIDRFVAVTQPIKYAKQRNQPRVFGMIGISWLISVGVALPLALGVNEDPNRNAHDCQINNPDFLIYSSMCSFYIPCVVILCLYGRIFIEIRRRSRKKESVISRGRCRNGPHGTPGKKQLKVSIESENTSTLEPPPPRRSARAQALPRISYSEAERNSGDTNDTSDEQPAATDSDAFRSSLDANKKPPSLSTAPLPRPAHDFACCIRHEYSVSELSFSSSFQRGSSMRMNVSRTASFELYENAFTDMDYVDEIDSPPRANASANANATLVLENCAALPARASDMAMRTIKEEPNGNGDATVTANHHAIVTFEKDKPARLLTANYCCHKQADAIANTNANTNTNVNVNVNSEATSPDERLSSAKSSPSTRNEHTKLFKLTRRKSEVRRDRSISRERKVTKVMIIVLACFLACWMPFFCLNLVNAFCLKYGSTSDACRIERQLFIALTWLGYINSSLNPLIYCWQNREFRKAFLRLLTCKGQPTGRRRH